MRNAIHRFVHEALTTDSITYYGTPTALRDYVHVDDASSATLHVLGPEFANQNIFISGNQPMRVADLFRMISEMLGKELEIRYQNDPNSGHYQVTPYAFMPWMGRKLMPPLTWGRAACASWKRNTARSTRNCRARAAIWCPPTTEVRMVCGGLPAGVIRVRFGPLTFSLAAQGPLRLRSVRRGPRPSFRHLLAR